MGHGLRALFAAALLWGAGASGGAAQGAAGGAPLSAAELRAALLGHELSGVTEVSGLPWLECIDRNGDTVYRIGTEAAKIGRLQVTEDGQACFAYAESGFTDQSCWTMRRRGRDQLQFDDTDGTSESFLVLARPRVDGCGRDAPFV